SELFARIAPLNPPPAPPRRGATPAGQFPSWEGSGVGWLPEGSWAGELRIGSGRTWTTFARLPLPMNRTVVARASRPCELGHAGETPAPLFRRTGSEVQSAKIFVEFSPHSSVVERGRRRRVRGVFVVCRLSCGLLSRPGT